MAKQRVLFCDRLRDLRKARGLSLRELSEILQTEHKVDISHTALAKWEKDVPERSPPRREFVAALCNLFNVEPSFLLDEIFSVGPAKKHTDGRINDWQDVDLLSDERYQILLSIKQELLKAQDVETRSRNNGSSNS